MVPEAPWSGTMPAGCIRQGEGWFVLNARDAQWFDSTPLGLYAPFEGEHARFAQVGINISVLRPGEPMCMYHREGAQEDFLVLSGECVLVIEGRERELEAWDLVHCPPDTEHVLVGAGSTPSVVLSVGARKEGRSLLYPRNEAALRHGAGVEADTSDPSEAHARFPKSELVPCPAELP